MSNNFINDLRAAALGIGAALVVYYGLAVRLVLAGQINLDRPVSWLGLAAGILAIGWALSASSPDND